MLKGLLKGFHLLDGYTMLHTYDLYPVTAKDIKRLDEYFDKFYNRAEKRGIKLESDLTIILGDWRKFDPNYDPDEIFRLIEEEGRQGREFKARFYGV